MLIDVLHRLQRLGVEAEIVRDQVPISVGAEPDALVRVWYGGVEAAFSVECRRRPPYPKELSALAPKRAALRRSGTPLLVTSFVSEALGAALGEAGWSWADTVGNCDIRAPGLLLKQRRTTEAPKPPRAKLPGGPGSAGVIRALLDFRKGETEEPGATALAAQAKVSQPRASQVLRQLRELQLVERTEQARWRPRKEALLDRFLAEYAGPGGSAQYFYSLESPVEVARNLADTAAPRRDVAVSADVGPDLIASWRRPSLLIAYVRAPVALEELGLVEAQGTDDANVIVREPSDESVFPSRLLVTKVNGVEVPLADPTQMIWDLLDLGGADREAAAGVLRQWLLERP